jgi:hypothetical protein
VDVSSPWQQTSSDSILVLNSCLVCTGRSMDAWQFGARTCRQRGTPLGSWSQSAGQDRSPCSHKKHRIWDTRHGCMCCACRQERPAVCGWSSAVRGGAHRASAFGPVARDGLPCRQWSSRTRCPILMRQAAPRRAQRGEHGGGVFFPRAVLQVLLQTPPICGQFDHPKNSPRAEKVNP